MIGRDRGRIEWGMDSIGCYRDRIGRDRGRIGRDRGRIEFG